MSDNITSYTPAEAAEFYGVPIQTVYRWVRGRHLRSTREGRFYWIDADAMLAFKPPVGIRVRPVEPGESQRSGQIWGAAAAAVTRARNRREFVARERSAIAR
jgi:excisionase family DNA binding protein